MFNIYHFIPYRNINSDIFATFHVKETDLMQKVELKDVVWCRRISDIFNQNTENNNQEVPV